MFKKLLFASAVFFLLPFSAFAQAHQEKYLKAQVLEVVEEGERQVSEEVKNPYQKLLLKLLDGENAGAEIEIEHGGSFALRESQKLHPGQTVVLLQTGDQYNIIDQYRLGNLTFIFSLFFLAAVFIGGIKGFTSMLGMLISLLVVLKFIVPQILAGHSPILISILGSLFIMTTTIYLAHGFNPKTHVALFATFICLVLTGLLATLFIQMAYLTGLGSEEAYSLTLGQTSHINFKGLLLGGIIIGALGVLDDVTTSQSAAVFELAAANPRLSTKDLFIRGLKIGREHVASMINTLVLAYAGASIALFLIFYISAQGMPFWVVLNSETIAEEIVRSLAGSLGLIMAVPVTTLLASRRAKLSKK